MVRRNHALHLSDCHSAETASVADRSSTSNMGRHLRVVHRDNEKQSFITTDSPVFLGTVVPRPTSIYGVGFGSPDAFISFQSGAAGTEPAGKQPLHRRVRFGTYRL
jgi:hypothetical protein